MMELKGLSAVEIAQAKKIVEEDEFASDRKVIYITHELIDKNNKKLIKDYQKMTLKVVRLTLLQNFTRKEIRSMEINVDYLNSKAIKLINTNKNPETVKENIHKYFLDIKERTRNLDPQIIIQK